LDRDSKAQAEQVRSVSVDRVTDLIGTVAPELMLEVDEALRLHLAI
jgi:mRNA interferase MazF